MVKPAGPKIYNEFIDGLELETLCLEKLNVGFLGSDSSNKTELEIKLEDIKRKILQADNKLKILHRFKITINHEGKKDIYYKFDCTFALVYRTVCDMSPGIWEVFKNRNLYVVTWPYLRELFHNTLYRFNLPPLTLPARKV